MLVKRFVNILILILLVLSVPTTIFYSETGEAHVHKIDTLIEFENVTQYPIIIYVFKNEDSKQYDVDQSILKAVSYQSNIELPLIFSDSTKLFAFSDINENGILDKNEAGVPLEPVATEFQAIPLHGNQNQTIIRMQFDSF